MKIAVEFYGHLRTFRETADNIIENFIKPLGNDVDIFIHCWDKTDHSDLTWHNTTCEKRGLDVTQDDKNFIEEKYHPKKFLCEPQIIVTPEEDKEYTLIGNGRKTTYRIIKNTYYTRYMANKLRQDYEKETGVKYDYVIQSRLDLIFSKPADFLNNHELTFIKNKEDKIFYAWCGSDKQMYNCIPIGPGGTDIIYFAAPQAMDKFVNLYEKLPTMDLNKELFSWEVLLLNNGINEGLQPITFNFITHRDFTILRTQETIDYINKKNNEKSKIKFSKKIKYTLETIFNAIFFILSLLPLFNILFKSNKYFEKIAKYYNKIKTP